MKIKGVDLSYCQEGISFPVLKQAGVRFAIIRAGFSTKKDVTMDKFLAEKLREQMSENTERQKLLLIRGNPKFLREYLKRQSAG